MPATEETSVSVTRSVAGSYDSVVSVTTPSAEILTVCLRSASERPVRRSRTSLAEFVSPPAKTADLVTFHHSLEISSYVVSLRRVTPPSVLPTSSPSSLYTFAVVRTKSPDADVVARARVVAT